MNYDLENRMIKQIEAHRKNQRKFKATDFVPLFGAIDYIHRTTYDSSLRMYMKAGVLIIYSALGGVAFCRGLAKLVEAFQLVRWVS